MSRVTSKLQVTIPKAVADRYEITPGAEVVFEPAGDVIRVVPQKRSVRDPRERVRLFEQALARQRQREKGRVFPEVQDRGWSREDLYDRGRSR
jgi:AbrB family looped-hinge helix DNA binding protein